MARQSENSRHSKYVIRIICEGEKTEPLFFTSLCDKLLDENEGREEWDVKTIPQPDIPDETQSVSDRGLYKSKMKKIKGKKNKLQQEVQGQPPLSWIHLSRKKLKEGVDEAWAVFDKDEHPARREAFEEAEKVIDGKKVHIAFSSRSFEYYLLLHFEYLYYAFHATECGERIDGKKVNYDCMMEKAKEDSCHGEKCINGYARLKKYWNETKTSQSTFPLIEKRLKAGIINARRLRIESDNKESCPIYNRNPYTDVDKLVCRLTHTEIIPYGEECLFNDSGDQLFIRMHKNVITVCNRSSHTIVLPEEFLKKYNWKTGKYDSLSNRCILPSNEYTFWTFALKEPEVILIKRNRTHAEYIFFPY